MVQVDTPAANKKAKGGDDSAAQGSTTVFIKNLPWSATDEELANFFADCGEVTEVRIGAHLPVCDVDIFAPAAHNVIDDCQLPCVQAPLLARMTPNPTPGCSCS